MLYTFIVSYTGIFHFPLTKLIFLLYVMNFDGERSYKHKFPLNIFFPLFGQTLHPQVQKTSSEDADDHYTPCCRKVQELIGTGVALCQTGVIQGSHMASTSALAWGDFCVLAERSQLSNQWSKQEWEPLVLFPWLVTMWWILGYKRLYEKLP